MRTSLPPVPRHPPSSPSSPGSPRATRWRHQTSCRTTNTCTRLEKVTGLKEIAAKHLDLKEGDGLALGMEFVLEALHQHSMVSKREEGVKTAYRDMLKAMFDHMSVGGDN